MLISFFPILNSVQIRLQITLLMTWGSFCFATQQGPGFSLSLRTVQTQCTDHFLEPDRKNIPWYDDFVTEKMFSDQAQAAGIREHEDLIDLFPALRELIDLDRLVRSAVIFEVGGGYGRVVEYLSHLPSKPEVTVFEHVPQWYSYLEQRYRLFPQIHVVEHSFFHTEFKRKGDLILALFAMILEVNDLDKINLFFKRAQSRLRKKGVLVVDVPVEIGAKSTVTFLPKLTPLPGGHLKIVLEGTNEDGEVFHWEGLLPEETFLVDSAYNAGLMLVKIHKFKRDNFPDRKFYFFKNRES